jgi:uncharacterized repeat protein (TIGR03847 family)
VPRQVFTFDPPERFVAGTVGEPGQRTFFLQARDASQLATVLVEKEQVAILADRLDALLDEVVRRTAGSAGVSREQGEANEDLDPLELPIVEEFRVGTLTIAWDGVGDRVVIEAFALAEAGEEESDEPAEDGDDARVPDDRDLLVVRLTATSARAFARRARALIAAGRPPCPLCGLPLDPSGHVCPRQNGYRRRS